VAVQADGKVLVAASLDIYRSGLVRLTSDGSVDPSFVPNYSGIEVITLQPDGRILIGGSLQTVDTRERAPAVVRLNPNGTKDETFVFTNVGMVKTIVLQPDGKILVYGNSLNDISSIGRLNANGSLDTTFLNLGGLRPPYVDVSAPIGVWPDGRILFYSWRLSANGAHDTTYNVRENYTVNAVIPLSNGKAILGGFFDTFGTLPRDSQRAIARINTDGSLDTSYRFPFTVNFGILRMAVQPDGRIVALTGADIVRIYEGQIISSPPLASAIYGTSFTYPIKATNSPTLFNATGLPPGLSVTQSSGVITGSPTQTGTFNVALTATGASGAVTGTLVISVTKRSQTITFSPVGTVTVGQAISLNATASSGLPVSFVVASGNATLTGATLTLRDNNPVVVRAVQSGNDSYEAATINQTISPGVLTQTITPPSVAQKKTTDSAFTVLATSSSGLPVTLEVASGPATIARNTVTLSGAPGTVVMRAVQAGNETFLPAPPITFSFAVRAEAPVVYFGAIGADGRTGDFAVYYTADLRRGTLLGSLATTGEVFAIDFAADATGGFMVTETTSIQSAPASVSVEDGPNRSALGVSRIFRGSLEGGVFSGTIDGLTLSATVSPPLGAASGLTGTYRATVLGAANGSVNVIVAANGRVYAVATTNGTARGAAGSLNANGGFTIPLGSTASLTGAITAETGSISGTITAASQPTANFLGLSSAISPNQRIVNLATRGFSGQDANVLIAGFVVSGSSPKPVLLRAIGPALSSFGITGVVSAPRLRLYRGTDVIAENNGWGTILSLTELQSATTRVGAFSLPAGSKDSALLVTLDPGSYTIQASDPSGSGIALCEIYDASPTATTDAQRLINLSTRGRVGSGDDALIGGFAITGNTPKQLLIRGIGNGLAGLGVTDAVPNTLLRIYQNSVLVLENDDWDATPDRGQLVLDGSRAVGAFPLVAGSKDAAVVTSLAPGAYTAVVSTNGASVGVGLLEIYEISR
jgi:uncharacterized delta-60 repeat protein